MSGNTQILIRVFSPRLIGKALSALDKSTAIVVGMCWLAAVVMLIAASMSVHSVMLAKKEAADATIATPVLPEATTIGINAQDAQQVVGRLQRQFPDIKFDIDGNQMIFMSASEGSKFHQWITALGYIDAMAPQYRWTLRTFCVGKCNSGQDLMKASVTGQKMTFSLPK
jgi:hypothetical protein